MKDKYLGDLIESEVYEYFDGRICYIDKIHTHYCVVYETERAIESPWKWNLRSRDYLLRNIRTIMEV